jgi:hypothetical protein
VNFERCSASSGPRSRDLFHVSLIQTVLKMVMRTNDVQHIYHVGIHCVVLVLEAIVPADVQCRYLPLHPLPPWVGILCGRREIVRGSSLCPIFIQWLQRSRCHLSPQVMVVGEEHGRGWPRFRTTPSSTALPGAIPRGWLLRRWRPRGRRVLRRRPP